MICGRCQHPNRAGAKFCEECAAPLQRKCAYCGGELSASAKFCPECAHPVDGWNPPKVRTPQHLATRILSSRAALEGERKQVTILFADLKGSMELLSDRDPEDARRILEQVIERMVSAVHRFEGTVNQVMGDGIMALFGAPIALEDHAVRACYAALAMQVSLREYAEELRRTEGVVVQIRIGMNSGEVVVGAIGSDLRMEYTAVGQSTHLAARMEQLAAPGTILMSGATLALAEGYVQVKSLGPVPVKGMPNPVDVFEIQGTGTARTRLQVSALRGLSKFVGRANEMAQMFAALDRVQLGHGEIVALVGEPGVGKSRLVWEFTHSHRLQSWYVLESGSVSYGRASAYKPVIDLLHVYFGLESQDNVQRIRERVIGKLLALDRSLEAVLSPLLALLDVATEDSTWERLDPQLKRRRMLDGCRGLLLRESQRQPLVVVFEDLHWIDAESQNFLDVLVESLPSARILLLVNYRPEYQNRWTGKTFYTQQRVAPLALEGAQELLDALLGPDPSLVEVRHALQERTASNPLFIEESVRSMAEAGLLVGERGAYRAAEKGKGIEVPLSVQAVLAARIDRLNAEDKRLLQTAAVIGKDVPYEILLTVAELDESALQAGLMSLQSAEFIYEVSLYPNREYTFKHALTHEVAYAGILQEKRRTLHARILSAMESVFAGRLAEHVDLIGHQALQAEMWDRAFEYLYQAGKKAYLRSALRSAVAAYEKALTAFDRVRRDASTVRRASEAHVELSQCWMLIGDFKKQLEHCRSAEELADKANDDAYLGWAVAGASVALFSVGDHDAALREARRADDVFGRNAETRLVTGFYPSMVHTFVGRFQKGIDEASRCVRAVQEHPMLASDENAAAAWASSVSGWSRVFRSWCSAEMGQFDDAQLDAQQGVEALTDFGYEYGRAFAIHRLGFVQLVRGNLPAALVNLERCDAIAHEIDSPTLQVHLGACLGYALMLAGRVDEAVHVQERAIRIATDTHNMTWIPVVSAHSSEAYIAAGRVQDSLSMARNGLDLARKHGMRGQEAWVLHALTRALIADDQYEIAIESCNTALALTHELGMRPLEARCHLAMGEILIGVADRDKARSHLMTSLFMYQSLGTQHWPDVAQRLLDSIDAKN